jgi:hypothetical protein
MNSPPPNRQTKVKKIKVLINPTEYSHTKNAINNPIVNTSKANINKHTVSDKKELIGQSKSNV